MPSPQLLPLLPTSVCPKRRTSPTPHRAPPAIHSHCRRATTFTDPTSQRFHKIKLSVRKVQLVVEIFHTHTPIQLFLFSLLAPASYLLPSILPHPARRRVSQPSIQSPRPEIQSPNLILSSPNQSRVLEWWCQRAVIRRRRPALERSCSGHKNPAFFSFL